jgi:hypothetical protein
MPPDPTGLVPIKADRGAVDGDPVRRRMPDWRPDRASDPGYLL